jgi:hypothetical protein
MATLIDVSKFHIFSYVSGGILLAYSLVAVLSSSKSPSFRDFVRPGAKR